MSSPGPEERMVPEAHQGQVSYLEHILRYRFCAQFAPGRRVLDVATGSGYGAHLLAQAGAQLVVGIDRDHGAIAYARRHYPGPMFVLGDAHHLPFPDGSFQLVVSLETIEHLEHPEAFLDEVRRVLARDGLLVLSTPQKDVYPPGNPYHLREFTADELISLLQERFRETELWLQDLWLASAALPKGLLPVQGPAPSVAVSKEEPAQPSHCLYLLALASDSPLPHPQPHVGLGPRYSDFVLRELIRRDVSIHMLQGAKEAAEAEVGRLREEVSALRQEVGSLREAAGHIRQLLEDRERALAQAHSQLRELGESIPLLLWQKGSRLVPPSLKRALRPALRALRRRLQA
jgi:SAM-dependent methyltransferase